MDVFATHWLCEDCTLYSLYGDLPPDADQQRKTEICAGVHNLGPNLVPDFSEGDGDGEFSWHTCDACLSPLGGRRYRFATLGEN
jgi:predicted metal-dependent enzyme (double-stranded beta helix superfamily)